MKPEKNIHPPRWAARLLEWCCPPHVWEELQGDLQELFEERVQQLGPARARRKYILNALGFVRPFAFKRKRVEYSEGNFTDMLVNYLKVAGRNLSRHKMFSFIHIAGLSLGLACCMLILLYTRDEVSYDRFHEKTDRIFRVVVSFTGEDGTVTGKTGSTNMIVGPSFKEEIPEVKTCVRMNSASLIVRNGADLFEQSVLYADESFFSVFSFPLEAGHPGNVLRDLNAVVLTEGTAEKYFGTTNVVGRVLEVKAHNEFEPFVITGIAKDPPQNSSVQFSMLLPYGYVEKHYPSNEWLGFYINTFVVLRPGADHKVVEPKLNQLFRSKTKGEAAGTNENVHFGLLPLQQVHLDTEYGDIRNGLANGSNPVYSYILSGIAVFILIIACINFTNLTLAHSLKRSKEIGIRKITGGQRRQLIAQFLGESFVICFLAFAVAIVLVQLALPFFNELANKRLNFSYLLDAPLVAGYLLLLLATALTAGFYPALVLSGFSPVKTLYNRHQSIGRNSLAKGLVVFQFSLATFLIIATVGVYAQFDYLIHKDLGYNDENLVKLSLGRGRHEALVRAFKNELADEPSIEVVTTKDPAQNYTVGRLEHGQQIGFAISWIDDTYLPALRIPVLKGRNFSRDFPADTLSSIIVNETFVKKVGWEEPVGKIVEYNKQRLEVVGVAKDHHFVSLKEKIQPQLFKYGLGVPWIKIQPGRIPEAVQAVHEAHKKLVPFRPLDYEFMNAINERAYEAEARWKQIVTIGAGLSILISCMGLFGLALRSIQQRTKEIGVRKVLGAAVSDIVLLLSRDFMRMVVLAFVFGIPLGYYAIHRWLENFPYRIHMEWWLFVLPCLATLLVALLTITARTVQAAATNPVNSLRNE